MVLLKLVVTNVKFVERSNERNTQNTVVKMVKRKKIRNNSPSKLEVMSHYSKKISKMNVPCCACCGEDLAIDILTIDHIKGRKKGDKRTGEGLYRYLIRNNFPSGYQVLCFNCNAAKGLFGISSHQE